MTLSLALACLWAVTASAIALLPSRHHHWPAAYVLIAVGIPLLGYVTYENGPTAGVLCLAAGASILRWPLIYAVRGLRRLVLPAPRVVTRDEPTSEGARNEDRTAHGLDR